jgi:hypothetical protein
MPLSSCYWQGCWVADLMANHCLLLRVFTAAAAGLPLPWHWLLLHDKA